MPRRHQQKKKAVKNSGLGHAMKNKYGGKPERENQASGRVKRKDHIIDPFAATPAQTSAQSKLKSITEVSNLQEFVDTMAAHEELQNRLQSQDTTRILAHDATQSTQQSELNYQSELKTAELFNYKNLPIPRKPAWDSSTTAQQLQTEEQQVFLQWRRSLAKTASNSQLSMTPFEKNLEVWKQLWNVVERSHLLILIVDARNPLAFISRDLFTYVSECNDKPSTLIDKRCLLLINKADYLTPLQRRYWKLYFDNQSITVLFFSAMREQIRLDLLTKSHRDKLGSSQRQSVLDNTQESSSQSNNSMTHILSVDELVQVFDANRRDILRCKDSGDAQSQALDGSSNGCKDKSCAQASSGGNVSNGCKDDDGKIVVGFVGYPNVGKSSIINVLMNRKAVSVGSTPGKTKHFQTLLLSETVMLCDCPGLVFPTLVGSKADMVLNGVIPIDHLNDFITPVRLMVHRLFALGGKQFNEVYKLRLPMNKRRRKLLTCYDVLDAYCHQRGMYNKSKVPNRNEAARSMLKDYVKGKLVYKHHPPMLTSRNRYLFYNGKLLPERAEIETVQEEEESGVGNVLDMDKLMGTDVELLHNAEDEDSESQDSDVDGGVIGVTDEEFLEIWKHPMDEYGGSLGTSKKKHEKKARVMRRIQKKSSKSSRGFRHDSDNFARGSNAVVVSAVPHISNKHAPITL